MTSKSSFSHIADILLILGEHLKPSSLASCVRVCKHWHGLFLPLLYGTLDICEVDHNDTEDDGTSKFLENLPSSLALHRNGHFYRNLYLNLPCQHIDLLATTTRNLRVVILAGLVSFDEDTLDEYPGFQTLLFNNARIERLDIRGCIGTGSSRAIGRLVQCCPNLKDLNVEECHLNLPDIAYLKGCPWLSTIKLDVPTAKPFKGHSIQVPPLPNLKSLELSSGSCPDNVDLITVLEVLACWTQLEKISLLFYSNDPYDAPLPCLSEFPSILHLKIRSELLSDQNFARLLEQCSTLSTLHLHGQDVGKDSLSALINLAHTLTSLDLIGFAWKEITILRPLLCSLPKLTHFRCSRMDIEFMFPDLTGDNMISVQGGEKGMELIPLNERQLLLPAPQVFWACTHLKSFQVTRLISSLDTERNRIAWNQWRSLREIENFLVNDIYRSKTLTEPGGGFGCNSFNRKGPFELSKGQKLDRSDLARDPEWQWVMEAWPNIQFYTGPTLA